MLCDRGSAPSLSKVFSIQTPDLESQEHIITYQVPIAIEREKIGLVIIDSIAANYRAERDDSNTGSAMAERSGHLAKLGAHLRSLARDYNCAIVVANQVSDRFAPLPPTAPRTTAKPLVTSSPYQPSSSLPQYQQSKGSNPLVLDHQLRFFSGWGSDPASGAHSLKSPSLGLVWANQIACRIVLIKEACYKANPMVLLGEAAEKEFADWSSCTWRRWIKVAFSSWVEGTSDSGHGVEFEIWSGGLRAVNVQTKDVS